MTTKDEGTRKDRDYRKTLPITQARKFSAKYKTEPRVNHCLEHEIVDVDVLVRADGGGWPLPSIGFPRLADSISADVTLVKFDDNGDARLARDAQNRLADYRGRGWKVAPFPVQAASENDFDDLIQRQDEAADRDLVLPRSELAAQPGCV